VRVLMKSRLAYYYCMYSEVDSDLPAHCWARLMSMVLSSRFDGVGSLYPSRNRMLSKGRFGRLG
jgi:hypothetical protein